MANLDPKNVRLSFGPLLISGFAEGSYINVNWLGEGSQAFAGAYGNGVIVESHDRRAEITFRLQMVGEGRNIAAALTGHFLAGNPALPVVLASEDTGHVLGDGAAKLKRVANAEFATAQEPVEEWTIVCANLLPIRRPDVGGVLGAIAALT